MKHTFSKAILAFGFMMMPAFYSQASSHREAPFVAQDPQADNIDLYAFKSPNDSNKIIIIANYIPMELPHGGATWYTFGQNIRYEIHIKNDATTSGDDITYRFSFDIKNEDPNTIFNIRQGKQNLKNTYKLERRVGATNSFTTLITNGVVPPPNIGPRSIEGATGLAAANYDSLMQQAIMTSASGERVYAGPIDDPYFGDLGGMFDLGGYRQPGRDALAKFNCHTIAMEIPVSTLQKSGKKVNQALSMLDPDFVIGVWASASRPAIMTFSDTGAAPSTSGNWVQISRVGMPLTNNIIIPIGKKDLWNCIPSGSAGENQFIKYFNNPEVGLYVDSSSNGYGKAVPGLSAYLRIQSASTPATGIGPFDFRNTKSGLFPLKGSPALIGTAFDPGTYGNLFLPNGNSPRSVDVLPFFMTGFPNQAPYQLAVLKAGGNPMSMGKPVINNFLPVVGDMLRLNMATPATPRTIGGLPNPQLSSMGILAAMMQGVTNTTFNTSTNLQNIPNMDGFPNGRRLEDDVNSITLQMMGGAFLAGMGYYYDDYNPNTATTVLTPQYLSTIGFSAGINHNDTTFKAKFPFVQQPWRAYTGGQYEAPTAVPFIGQSLPLALMVAYPNPFTNQLSFKYKLPTSAKVQIELLDINGRLVSTINEGNVTAGEHFSHWNGAELVPGNYFARFAVNNQILQTIKLVKTN